MAIKDYNHKVAERLMRYVQIDTTADPNSTTFPSTEIQKDLGRLLVQELLELGVKDAEMDEWGCVFGTVKGNTSNDVPTVCFCAHLDTAPDVTGQIVKPILHNNYDGKQIKLIDDKKHIIIIEKQLYFKVK